MVEKSEVVEKLKTVIDPHTRQSVWDMGLIERVEVENDVVDIIFRPSSPFCPIGQQLAFAIKRSVEDLGVKARVKVVGYVKENELNEALSR
ncbi:iron-sulfur cluster assembly protein [Geoglobus acetivorans]